MTQVKQKHYALFGALGSVGALCLIFTDIASHIGSYRDICKQIGNMTPLQLGLASHLAVLIIPLLSFGIFALYQALKPGGKSIAAMLCIGLYYLTYLMECVHAGYPYIAQLVQSSQSEIILTTIRPVLSTFSQNISLYLIGLYIGAFIVSLGLFIIIICGKTSLKRSMAFCNPIITIVLSFIVGMISPKWGIYYGYCCPMVGLFLIFLCTTLTFLKK